MKHVHLFLIIIIIFTLSISLVSCQSITGNKTDAPPTFVSKFDKLIIPSAQQNVNDAYDLAREWSPDAILIYVDVVVPPGEVTEFVMFTFISKINSQELLILSFENNTATTEISDWSGAYSNFREIELDQWFVDSTKVFEIAQRNGGQEFMANNSGDIDIKLILEATKNNNLVWRVSYRSVDGNGTVYIGIDATTGEFMWIDLP